MAEVDRLAAFVRQARLEDLSLPALEQLKIRVLDTVGVAIAALPAEPVRAIRRLTDTLGGTGLSTLVGGGRTAPDRAAFYNAALARYLDFMDSYLAAGETNHPSDNIAPVLAAADYRQASGAEFLTAVAVAYQVHTRLADVAPVRDKGFDHTTQGAYAVAAGAAKVLGLDEEGIANAIAISGTANNALRVTRTGSLSHWKGLAYPNVAKEGTHAALLAEVGITGPREVFEGNKGFRETIAGDFHVDWSGEDLESVRRTVIKKHNAEIHSQSALDAALDLRGEPGFDANAVDSVRLRTFHVAHQIIGGGEEGDKRTVWTKEEADHSLPYMVAVALLDGEVQPEQYEPQRIAAADVQRLLRKVEVQPEERLSTLFPQHLPAELEVRLTDGRLLRARRNEYRGFHSDPLDWTAARQKFDRVTRGFTTAEQRNRIADVIASCEDRPTTDLTSVLAEVGDVRRYERRSR